ncbi:hypothetical protein [Magnetospirillum aberrantis]|uniref:Uncharacterized protein n=1 Tax=Magnetospirillum aberrantis SpK TaxID=908842 RepID=A0A7C9QWZ6_9PROT|nr:hypothetical protein [Magnetospirillum aberrantis]NFV81296.1 hypothetical protein [Magnetospirillum aberrantis SpK]
MNADPDTKEYVRSALRHAALLAELIDHHGREDLRPEFEALMFDLGVVARLNHIAWLADLEIRRH